jgi:hypothetical protein
MTLADDAAAPIERVTVSEHFTVLEYVEARMPERHLMAREIEPMPLFAAVIASEAKRSMAAQAESWIASSRILSSGAHSRDPLAPRNDEPYLSDRPITAINSVIFSR